MSATTKTEKRSVQQRSSEATARLRGALDVSDTSPTALKLLSAAVAEVAATEAELNPHFLQRLRDVYASLTDESRPRATPRKPVQVELIPIAAYDVSTYDPFAPPDPYFLLKIYGGHQLSTALCRYTLAQLKLAMVPVERQNPGTRPSNRSKKDAIIDYIVEHVAGPGY